MKYYIQDRISGGIYECNHWWDLVAFFYDGNTSNDFHRGCKINDIAHNENDIGSYWEMKFNRNPDEFIDYNEEIVKEAKRLLTDQGLGEYHPNRRHLSNLRYMVFDSFDRIINKRDIQEAFRKFDYDLAERKFYRPMNARRVTAYRFGGNRHWHGRRRNVNRNKKYKADLQEYIELFPSDGRIRDACYILGYWSDDFTRSKGRTWKDQSKKKKQWM